MSVDHSLSYRKLKFKNIPHKLRLNRIVKTLKDMERSETIYNFIDVGCSNGFITNIIANTFNVKNAKGVDYEVLNLKTAATTYPYISFEKIDLNVPIPDRLKSEYDLITCFETLEHVGDLKNAIQNIIKLGKERSKILLTVPIEIGFWGTIKFLLKRFAYKGYTLEELGKVSTSRYFASLLKGENISTYREPGRKGWGTHFGFDYRIIDLMLAKENVTYKAKNYFTTRFYMIVQK